MTRLAIVDDYPEPGLGHHPDLLVGLAEASLRVPGLTGLTRIYCPSAFIVDRTLPAGIDHRPFVRPVGVSPSRHREQMSAIHREAGDGGAGVFLNLFFDESHRSFPVRDAAPRVVQVLHRPAELADEVAGTGLDRDQEMVAYLRRTAPAGLFVVHTQTAYHDALAWLPAERLILLPWPSASESDVTERFAAAAPGAGQEPHVLLIGDAREAKGIHVLLTALAGGGPLLRIVGQQPRGVEAALRDRYPATRVEWETGWIPQSRLSAAISAASTLVFPYLKTFSRHGGVSGALAQALTFGKPLVVSTVLVDQLPESSAVLLVEPGDAAGLRQAINDALRRSPELHRAAAGTLEEVRQDHTYDQHLARIIARVTG